MMRSCVHVTLTHSELRMSAILDGTQFASLRQRASHIIFQPSHVSLSPSQTTHTAGTAQCYFFIWSAMDAGITVSWLSRQSSGEPLFSFCNIWLRREQHTLTNIAAPMIYFGHLRFGQMRVQFPNQRTATIPAMTRPLQFKIKGAGSLTRGRCSPSPCRRPFPIFRTDVNFWHPLRGAIGFWIVPEVCAPLRPPATVCQPSGLRK